MSLVRRAAAVFSVACLLFVAAALFWCMPFETRQGIIREAWAQVGCVPNPNVTAPLSNQFSNSCALPAGALNFFKIQVTPQVFGATGNGTTDDTGAVQGAASSLCATANARTLHFPPGTYKAHDILFTCEIYTEGEGKAASVIDYSAATTYGFRYQVPGFPSFKSNAHIFGGGIANLGFKRSAGNTWGLQVEGYQDFTIHDLTFNTPYDAIFLEGDENIAMDQISLYGTIDRDLYIFGDLSGETASGAACTTGNTDCSTRSDNIVIGNFNATDNTATNTCIEIAGFVNDVSGRGVIFCEGANKGFVTDCQAGLDPALTQCPHFIFADNVQLEFWKTVGLSIQDTLNVRMDKLYSYGNNVVGGNNAVSITTLNYGSTTACGGGQCQQPGEVLLSHSFLFSTRQDCALVQAATGTALNDVSIYQSTINGCNTSNGGFGAISVAPSGGAVTQGHFDGNTLCQVAGFSSSSSQAYGINYGSNATDFLSNGNSYFQCAVNVINTSLTNVESNPNPRPVFGTVTETDGFIGSTGTIVAANGNATVFSLTITPSGSGISSSGQFTVNLPANVSMRPGMFCSASASTTNWGNGALIRPVSSNATSATMGWFNFNNGALVNLTGSTAYTINMQCSPST